MSRLCNKCNKVKEKEEFSPSFYNAPSHHNVTCRKCRRGANKNTTASKGYIYIIINPAWDKWCKIGLTTTSPEQRLLTYQTGSPFRDYELYATQLVEDVYDKERLIHKQLEEAGILKQNEWFRIQPEDALQYFKEYRW